MGKALDIEKLAKMNWNKYCPEGTTLIHCNGCNKRMSPPLAFTYTATGDELFPHWRCKYCGTDDVKFIGTFMKDHAASEFSFSAKSHRQKRKKEKDLKAVAAFIMGLDGQDREQLAKYMIGKKGVQEVKDAD